jgi:hypothetical protein
VFQGKYEENDKSAQKGANWKFLLISRILEVNRDFQSFKMTPVIISEVDFKTVRRFRNNISNPDNFVGETPQMAAQPPLAVAKIIYNFHFIFPF